ncbi:MAG: hypothetical protein AAFU53_01575, partial [Cyanobacteria bacterium J06632_3]
FWVLCCEETEAARRISKSVADWHLPGVRSRLGYQLPLAVADAIAQSDYALFITPSSELSSELSIVPLRITQSINASPYSPAGLLATLHNRHGIAPESWWAKLPTAELSTQQTVELAVSKIKEFVRPYAFGVPANPTSLPLSHQSSAHQGHSAMQPQWRNCRKAYRI